MLKQAEVLQLLFVHVAVDELSLVYSNVRSQGRVPLESVVLEIKKIVEDSRDQTLECL
jgi:hypothetical protein